MNELIMLIAAFAAGLIDAIAGGGGLIQLPFLLILFPDKAPAVLMSTNKIAAFCGTTTALVTYARRVPIRWRLAGSLALIAAVWSALGASLVSYIPPDYFKPMVGAALIYVLFRLPKLTRQPHVPALPGASFKKAAAVACLCGLYDGFLGPGAGTIMVFLFAGILGADFVAANAHAKIMNVATNIGALVYFAAGGQLWLELAIPMAVCNVLGSLLGAKLAIARGNQFIAWTVRLMVIAVSLRLLADAFW